MFFFRLCGAASALLFLDTAATAHEFWLDAINYAPKPGASVPIVLRNGVDYLGDSYPYQRKWAKRFTVIDSRGERPLKATEGDDPATDIAIRSAGLTTVIFQRAPDVADYKTVAHFLEVLDDEGLSTIAAQVRSAPPANAPIQETYARFAKALLKAGDGAGQDRASGLDFEIVLETNPYETPSGGPLTARVIHLGKPVADVQVKVFNRPKGNESALQPRRLRTDGEGRIKIEGLGPGEVLLSTVVMQPTSPAPQNTAPSTRWTSLWASMTFRAP